MGLAEGTAHLIGGLNPPHRRLVAGALKVAGEENGVVLAVFHQQHAKRSYRRWLAIDLIRLMIWSAHRVW
jgi:hypothetical protein